MDEHSAESNLNLDVKNGTSPIDRDDRHWGYQSVFQDDGIPVKDYRRFVAGQSCVICGRKGDHVRRVELDGWWSVPGKELSDAYLISLCKQHDAELAFVSNKNEWWFSQRVDPVEEACDFWRAYHMFATDILWRDYFKANAAKKQT